MSKKREGNKSSKRRLESSQKNINEIKGIEGIKRKKVKEQKYILIPKLDKARTKISVNSVYSVPSVLQRSYSGINSLIKSKLVNKNPRKSDSRSVKPPEKE